MLSKIKLCIYAAVAGMFAIMFGWLKVTQSQRNAAVIEAEKQAQARMAESAKNKQVTEIHKARVAANEQAKQVKPSDTRGKRPTGNFGDKRL
jgi:hypothetical protein